MMRQWLMDCMFADPLRKDGLIVNLKCGRKLDIDSCTHVPGTPRELYNKDGVCVGYVPSQWIDNETERVI